MLSHYTSERGLIGITRSQSLWASEFLALNDRVEFVYALSAIYEDALGQTLPSIPEDLRDQTKGQEHIRSLVLEFIATLRKQVEESDGYGSIYVTSFARGRNEDEDERGILTLWDSCTRNEGYCVQFEKERVRRLIDHERRSSMELTGRMPSSDASLNSCRSACCDASLTKPAISGLRRIRIDPQSYFLQRLLSFCGKRKDSAFADEREIRIFACPVNATEARVFTGFATPKTIYRRGNRPDGAKYIVLGDTVLPGLIPYRIIIDPKAELRTWTLDALYPPPPRIKKSTIPIR